MIILIGTKQRGACCVLILFGTLLEPIASWLRRRVATGARSHPACRAASCVLAFRPLTRLMVAGSASGSVSATAADSGGHKGD